MNLHVEAKEGETAGLLTCGYMKFPCTVGGSGVGVARSASDSVTPLGTYTLGRVLWRADRGGKPETGLPVHEIAKSGDTAALWRDDLAFDLAASIDRGDGLAPLYLHVLDPNRKHTDMGIALSDEDLRAVLKRVNPGSRITISTETDVRL